MKRRLTPIALIAAALLSAGCYGAGGKRVELERSFPAAGLTSIDVRGVSGRIEVTGAETDVVHLRASGRTREGELAELADRIEIQDRGGSLLIRERGKKGSRRIFSVMDGGNPSVSFEILVPSRMQVSARTVNGRVSVEHVVGETALKSVNGRVQVSTPGATVRASTVNGSIRAEFQNRFRGASFKTINGSIGVEVPQDASLDLDIRQVNGSFQTDLPVVIETSGRRNTRGSLHGGRYQLEIETVNGSVRLRQADPAPSPFAGEIPEPQTATIGADAPPVQPDTATTEEGPGGE